MPSLKESENECFDDEAIELLVDRLANLIPQDHFPFQACSSISLAFTVLISGNLAFKDCSYGRSKCPPTAHWKKIANNRCSCSLGVYG